MNFEEAVRLEHSFEAGSFDVCVVGAGHAGCEAAHACAVLGLKTILFTLALDSLANLPCNPSIGGTSKGQLVREVDALGGVIGKMADKCAVQMRMLNRSKGPAVYSPRAQEDRAMYSVEMKHYLENTENLTLVQAHITELLTDENGNACGVMTAGSAVYRSKAVVICSGTYMESRTIRGEVITASGPDGLPRSEGLSASLKACGIPILRFKTGTPVRVNSNSCDFSQMTRQDGEDDVPPFSFENEMDGIGPVPSSEQIPCWSVCGVIKGVGPRYCPSIEDKFMRFADKERHQIFVEPMGRHTNEMYLQGFSTSLPEEVQIRMVRSLPGLSEAVIQRTAYAIEYDLVDPLSLKASLESKVVAGLFTAGQINGSSGYEEAAGQGIVAGINAAMKVLGRKPVIIDRSQGYIGVLIDDLVTKGTNEPYRMMTSRAEYRLFLRQDNADERLTPIGHETGLISDERYAKFLAKREAIAKETERLRNTYIGPTKALGEALAEVEQTLPKSGESLADLIKRPGVTYEMLAPFDKDRKELPKAVTKACETDIKYEGYLALEKEKIERFASLEKIAIPEDTDYKSIKGLRLEAAQKLSDIRPENVGRASRISGVSPADCEVLLVYLEQRRRSHAQ